MFCTVTLTNDVQNYDISMTLEITKDGECCDAECEFSITALAKVHSAQK